MNFYQEILTALQGFFGKPEATEAELHQQLTETKTVEALETRSKADAAIAVKTQMDALQAGLTELQSKFELVEASDVAKGIQITALQESVTALTASATEKDATINAQAAQIKTLSGELAAYKVGQPAASAAPPADTSIPVMSNPVANGPRVLSRSQFAQMFEN
jgi:hypothetical protein